MKIFDKLETERGFKFAFGFMETYLESQGVMPDERIYSTIEAALEQMKKVEAEKRNMTLFCFLYKEKEKDIFTLLEKGKRYGFYDPEPDEDFYVTGKNHKADDTEIALNIYCKEFEEKGSML